MAGTCEGLATPNITARGGVLRDLRRGPKIRQADLALRAGASRPPIVALEQGQPEVGPVLRTLETRGLTLTPADPPPAWMVKRAREAQAKPDAIAALRRARRRMRSD